MKLEFTHSECAAELTADEEYLHLDLGTPGHGALDGPRLTVRRSQPPLTGWCVIVHCDDGDPVKRFDITDHEHKLIDDPDP